MNKLIHEPSFAGQSLADRMMAAKHSITGQDAMKVIYKATTDEIMAPKRKHLDTLVWCTNNPNVSISQMANTLIERAHNSSWVVTFKALLTIHDLINYGNERFLQFLSTSGCSFNLSAFVDKTSPLGYEMSPYVRNYSRYINAKAASYKITGYDFCKVKRGKEDGFLRTIDTDKLLKALPILQSLLDILLEVNITTQELTNGIIIICFMTLLKDLVRMFAVYNDGIINLLEKYFDMNRKHATEALDVYKKFLARMDGVQMFLKVAADSGVNKSDIPDMTKAPSSLLEALEDHLRSFDENKKMDAAIAAAASAKPASVNRMSSVIREYSSAVERGSLPGAGSDGSFGITDSERRRILEEEERQLEKMKALNLRRTSGVSTVSARPGSVGGELRGTGSVTLSRTQQPLSRSKSAGVPSLSFYQEFSSVPAPDSPVYSVPQRVQTQTSVQPSASAKVMSPPPGFNNFGEILQPTLCPSATSTQPPTVNKIDLARLMSTSGQHSMTSSTFGQSSSAAVQMSPAFVVPITMSYSMQAVPSASQPYWMQPQSRMMMMPPGAAGSATPWTSPPSMMMQQCRYPSPLSPTISKPPPNDPFGAL